MQDVSQPIHATGDGSLGEMVALWRSGQTGGYSREFLAGTICADLGRMNRLVGGDVEENGTLSAEERAHKQEAETLLAQDASVIDMTLEGIDPQGFITRLETFVRSSWRKPEEDRAEEGFDLLCDYDAFHLILQVLVPEKLSVRSRQRLHQHKRLYRRITRMIEGYLPAFSDAASMVNSYCVAWNVEEDSMLSQVARFGSQEAEMVWEELNRAPDPLPEATHKCPDENRVALAFEGQLSASKQEEFDRHLKGCGHCCGLLDLLTATFVQLPARLPAAPQNALPQELRQPGLIKTLERKLRDIFDRIADQIGEFLLPPGLLTPTVVRGTAATQAPLDFTTVLQREVLIENPDVQAVLFLRGRTLYLSLLTDRRKTVRALHVTDLQTRKAQVLSPTAEDGEFHLGAVEEICNKQLEISFRIGKRQYRVRRHIHEGAQEQM